MSVADSREGRRLPSARASDVLFEASALFRVSARPLLRRPRSPTGGVSKPGGFSVTAFPLSRAGAVSPPRC
jgi:hypothetical protein